MNKLFPFLFAALLPCLALAQGLPGSRPEGQLVNFIDKTYDQNRGIRNGTYEQVIDFRIDHTFDLELTHRWTEPLLKTATLNDELDRPLMRLDLNKWNRLHKTTWWNYDSLALVQRIEAEQQWLDWDTSFYLSKTVVNQWHFDTLLVSDTTFYAHPLECLTHGNANAGHRYYRSGAYLNRQNPWLNKHYHQSTQPQVERGGYEATRPPLYLDELLPVNYKHDSLYLFESYKMIHIDCSPGGCCPKHDHQYVLPSAGFQPSQPIDLWHGAHDPEYSNRPHSLVHAYEQNEQGYTNKVFRVTREIAVIPCPEFDPASGAVQVKQQEGHDAKCYDIVSTTRKLAYTIEYTFYE